jgi:hypothetical protein
MQIGRWLGLAPQENQSINATNICEMLTSPECLDPSEKPEKNPPSIVATKDLFVSNYMSY